MKPYVEGLRREKHTDTKNLNVTLTTRTIEDLKWYGIESKRGGGNLSASVEVAMHLLMGVFNDPNIALNAILQLLNSDSDKFTADLQDIAENLHETGKLLYDLSAEIE